MNLYLEIVVLSIIAGFFVNVTAATTKELDLTCYECNTYRGSILNTCSSKEAKPKKKGCKACMKVHTRMEMHDYWNKPRVVTFESFTCVVKDFSVKPAGCYRTSGSRSITKVCYCYSDNCNSARRHDISRNVLVSMVLFSVLSSFGGLYSLIL